MRVLLTGGSGNVGSNILPLLGAEHEVRIFDCKPPAVEGVEYFEGDLLDRSALLAAMKGIDAVVHLAAIPNPNNDPDDRIMLINLLGSEYVFGAAAEQGVKRVIAASSDSTFGFVFGRPLSEVEFLPLKETHSAKPVDSYGASKLLMEELAARYTRKTGIETVMLRYCWVFIPQTYEVMEAIQADNTHAPKTFFTYIDARDVGQAVLKSLDVKAIPDGHQRFLLAAEDSYRPEPTLELVKRFYPDLPALEKPQIYLEKPNASLYDCSLAERIIGFRAQHSWRNNC